MDESACRNRRGPRAGPGPTLIGCALLIGAGILWVGCSVERDYKVLRIFFDGVPDPTIAKKQQELNPLDPVRDPKSFPTYTAHQPWKDGERRGSCMEECHGVRLQPTRNDSWLCLKCHAEKPTQYERMHGPVAAAACMWCHRPHESAYKWLLQGPDRAVCSQCHEPKMLRSERVPEHADETKGCLECHFGHGGQLRFLLREPSLAPPVPGEPPIPQPGGGRP